MTHLEIHLPSPLHLFNSLRLCNGSHGVAPSLSGVLFLLIQCSIVYLKNHKFSVKSMLEHRGLSSQILQLWDKEWMTHLQIYPHTHLSPLSAVHPPPPFTFCHFLWADISPPYPSCPYPALTIPCPLPSSTNRLALPHFHGLSPVSASERPWGMERGRERLYPSLSPAICQCACACPPLEYHARPDLTARTGARPTWTETRRAAPDATRLQAFWMPTLCWGRNASSIDDPSNTVPIYPFRCEFLRMLTRNQLIFTYLSVFSITSCLRVANKACFPREL